MKWFWTGVRKGMSVTWDTHGTVLSSEYVRSCNESVNFITVHINDLNKILIVTTVHVQCKLPSLS